MFPKTASLFLLAISQVTSPQDFAPFAGLRSLKKLTLKRMTQLSAQDVQDIQKTLKDCQVEQQN